MYLEKYFKKTSKMYLEKYFKKTSKEIRRKILTISNLAKSSHIGSSLSIVDLLLVLYKSYLKKKYFYFK